MNRIAEGIENLITPEEQSLQEYIVERLIRIVLFFGAIISGLVGIFLFITRSTKILSDLDFIFALVLFISAVAGFILLNRGYKKMGVFIPTVVYMFMGVYAAYTRGIDSTMILFNVLTVLIIVFFLQNRYRYLLAGLCVILPVAAEYARVDFQVSELFPYSDNIFWPDDRGHINICAC